MNEKDDDITHLGIVSEPEKTRDFAQFSNSPWTGQNRSLLRNFGAMSASLALRAGLSIVIGRDEARS